MSELLPLGKSEGYEVCSDDVSRETSKDNYPLGDVRSQGMVFFGIQDSCIKLYVKHCKKG